MVTVVRVRVEYAHETLGLGVDRPRLSWMVESHTDGWRQSHYEMELRDAAGNVRAATGQVESDESVLVAWRFPPLTSRERVAVRVRVWGTDGSVSAWSEPLAIETGLLGAQDWSARFVTPAWDDDTAQSQPAPLLRREFQVRGGVERARLYVTALGVYEPYLNGAVVGDQVMAPGWTSYRHCLRYQTFDVTNLLRQGRNAFGAMLGDGWFRGRLGFGGGRRNIYGDRLALLAQLEIHYADGTSDTLTTDENWKAVSGPILASDIYDGETYDARLERPGWSDAGYDDSDWKAVRALEWDLHTLVAPQGPPVRRMEAVAPVAVLKSPSGRTILDFGQNLVGRVRLTVQGAAGQTVTLRHAEVLEQGELCTRPLRTARATDRYILRGEGVETWEPRFTFHGFRYAEIENGGGELRLQDTRAIVCHSDMERTGWFECSDALLNQLHENIVWSMRGNFLDIPTDCPQRDERLGWTGDIQVFAPAASFLYDVNGFLASWLHNLALEQKELGGVVPAVVPNTISGSPLGAAAWGDAAVIVPWVLYWRFGDRAILAEQFESMRAWVDWIAGIAGEERLWNQGFQFGDWLDPAAPPSRPADARADRHLVATAYFARSAEIVGEAARVLGRAQDQAHYLALAREIREAFAREYVTPSGRLLSDAQTAYALAIEFGLLPDPAQRQRAAEQLVALVRANDYHIGTGFVGTPLICDALCHTGNYAAAYGLVLERGCPSWLYPVTMGATTIWERWDSQLPDGSINTGEMTSFNHYALGAVGDWLHRTVGGLAPAAPGYRQIAISPRPGGGLTHASARHLTPYGSAECAWTLSEGNIEVRVIVPPNATAEVILPGKKGEPIAVGAGAHQWSYPYQDPDARRALTVENTIGELSSDPRAWAAVMNALRRANPGSGFTEAVLKSQSKATLRQGLAAAPNADETLATIADALSALL